MGTPSLRGAIDSSVMYLLETAHSSFCSRRMAPTSRVMAASLGKKDSHASRKSLFVASFRAGAWRSLSEANGALKYVLCPVRASCELGG